MTRKEKLKSVFNLLWKILFVVGIVGVFASVFLDLFNRFEDCQNDNTSNISINRRINFNDYNYDDIVFIYESNYDIEQEDMMYSFDTYNANYNFKVGYNYKLIGCVSFPVVLNVPTDLLLVNNQTWQQLYPIVGVGGFINFNNLNDCYIYDFYFSGSSSSYLFLNVYFTTSAVFTMPDSYYLLFNIGSESRFTFDYSNVYLYLNFIETENRNSYQSGYDSGFSNGYNEGLQEGLTSGVTNGQDIYDNGYDVGYQLGYQAGLNDNTGANIFRNALLTIFDVPLMYISNLLNFNLLGVNFFGVFSAIITISICLWILQKVL